LLVQARRTSYISSDAAIATTAAVLGSVAGAARIGTSAERPMIQQRSGRTPTGVQRYVVAVSAGWCAVMLAFGICAAQPATEAPPTASGESCAAGIQYFEARNFQAAQPLLERCLESVGEDPGTLIRLTVAGSALRQLDSAVRYGERAVAAAPQDPEARYWFGRVLLESGDVAGAAREWETGLQYSTEHAGILEGLARLAIEGGEDQKAYGLLTQLQMLGVDEGWVYRLLSDLARRRGLWAQSLTHHQDLMIREGETGADLLIAGELSVLAGRQLEAIDYCRRAVALEPGAATYGGLGEIHFALGRHDSALTYLRQAVELDPDESRHRFNLANNLELLGLSDEAATHFQTYVAMEPLDPLGHLNYGVHLEKLLRPYDALDQVQEAVRLDADLLEARVVLAQLHEKLGQYGEAAAAVAFLLDQQTMELENRASVLDWHERLLARQREIEVAGERGQKRLLHIVTDDARAAQQIEQELAEGVDFALLATRFSTGSTAAQGGDIGWIAPSDMVEPLRSAIERLAVNENSPPIEAGGLYHFFRRIN